MEIFIYCKKDVIEDGVHLFKKGTTYEAFVNSSGSIDGRSEIDQYVTISTSGEFIFDDYFEMRG
jgi:hypothetical protein